MRPRLPTQARPAADNGAWVPSGCAPLLVPVDPATRTRFLLKRRAKQGVPEPVGPTFSVTSRMPASSPPRWPPQIGQEPSR
jgi:hypothetical protein